jgi:hypothetical protein
MASRRIAVIAVHGVADQQPNETACTIGNLLQNLQAIGGPTYTPFVVEPVRVPVQPLNVDHGAPPSYKAKPRQLIASYDKLSQINRSDGRHTQDTAYEFMYGMLRAYRGGDPAETYQTPRLSAARIDREEQRTVHVYEMYWADLSRLGKGVLRVFGELYQLIFHLGSLGVHAVNAASNVDGFKHWSWGMWAWCQRAAANTLAVWIALLNLVLAVLAAIGLVTGLAATYSIAPAAVTAVTVLIVVVAAGAFAYSRSAASAGGMIGYAAAGTAVAGALAWAAITWLGYARIGALELLAAGAALYAWLLSHYERRRPAARIYGRAIGAVFGAWAAIAFIRMGAATSGTPATQSVIEALLLVIEGVYLSLIVAWIAFVLTLLIAHFGGSLVKCLSTRQGTTEKQRTTGEQRARIFRACWTGRLTLALPAAAFLLVTLGLWELVGQAAAKVIPNFPYDFPLLHRVFGDRFRSLSSQEVIGFLVRDSGTSGLALMLVLLGVAVAIALWAVLPAALTEVVPPRSSSAHSTEALDHWLTNGFSILRQGGRLVYIGFAVVLPVFGLLDTFGAREKIAASFMSQDSIAFVRDLTGRMFYWFDAVLLASAGTLMLVRGRLKNIALGLRSPLDVLLDVDSYLREHPLDDNPRARICARYASLLRYVSQWKDRDGAPYDAVVIIAHSQGTVITADLLRFARIVHEPSLARLGRELPVYLLTMGCPLVQLYELRFPHLYNWVDDAVHSSNVLGLRGWVNMYRSGDYVGRSLELGLAPASGLWRDVCIGAGAHTHYWDVTAREVAVELDHLIAGA